MSARFFSEALPPITEIVYTYILRVYTIYYSSLFIQGVERLGVKI